MRLGLACQELMDVGKRVAYQVPNSIAFKQTSIAVVSAFHARELVLNKRIARQLTRGLHVVDSTNHHALLRGASIGGRVEIQLC
jgi:hypothetical protein